MPSATVRAESTRAVDEQRHESRSRRWVLPTFQARVITWQVLLAAMVATAAAWVILLAVWMPISDQLMWVGNAAAAEELFRQACVRVFITTGLLILTFGAVAFISGLILSHRVAGPLHRMSQVARRAAAGQAEEPMRLRRRDYIHDFADDFNELLFAMQKESERHRKTWLIVEEALGRLGEKAVASGAPRGAVEAEIEETLQKIREIQA